MITNLLDVVEILELSVAISAVKAIIDLVLGPLFLGAEPFDTEVAFVRAVAGVTIPAFHVPRSVPIVVKIFITGVALELGTVMTSREAVVFAGLPTGREDLPTCATGEPHVDDGQITRWTKTVCAKVGTG